MDRHSASYSIHDRVQLRVESSSSALLDWTEGSLEAFLPSGEGAVPRDRLELHLAYMEERLPQASDGERVAEEEVLWEITTGELVNRRYPSRLVASEGRSAVVEYFPAERKAYAAFSAEGSAYQLVFSCLIPVLDWSLKEYGFFLIHGAAVSKEGKGLLLVGPSGVGKSTTALLLATDGFSVLHDDLTWIRTEEASVDLCRVPGPIRLVEETLHLFEAANMNVPEGELRTEIRDPMGKMALFIKDVKDVPALRSALSARCVAVCFLERAGEQSSYQRLLPSAALVRLTDQSFIGDPLIAKDYLRTLIRLTEGIPQFVVTLGTDVLSVPPVFREILREVTT